MDCRDTSSQRISSRLLRERISLSVCHNKTRGSRIIASHWNPGEDSGEPNEKLKDSSALKGLGPAPSYKCNQEGASSCAQARTGSTTLNTFYRQIQLVQWYMPHFEIQTTSASSRATLSTPRRVVLNTTAHAACRTPARTRSSDRNGEPCSGHSIS